MLPDNVYCANKCRKHCIKCVLLFIDCTKTLMKVWKRKWTYANIFMIVEFNAKILNERSIALETWMISLRGKWTAKGEIKKNLRKFINFRNFQVFDAVLFHKIIGYLEYLGSCSSNCLRPMSNFRKNLSLHNIVDKEGHIALRCYNTNCFCL